MDALYYPPTLEEKPAIDELTHHGILGMRWGKQNGPPYPLSEGAHSASEKKAGWRKSLGDAIKEHKRKKAIKKRVERMNAGKKKAQERRAKEAEKQRKLEEKKKKIMKDPTKMYKNRDKFTTEEIEKQNRRFEAEEQLFNKNLARADHIRRVASTAYNYYSTAAKIYNSAVDVANLMNPNANYRKLGGGGNSGQSKKKKINPNPEPATKANGSPGPSHWKMHREPDREAIFKDFQEWQKKNGYTDNTLSIPGPVERKKKK